MTIFWIFRILFFLKFDLLQVFNNDIWCSHSTSDRKRLLRRWCCLICRLFQILASILFVPNFIFNWYRNFQPTRWFRLSKLAFLIFNRPEEFILIYFLLSLHFLWANTKSRSSNENSICPKVTKCFLRKQCSFLEMVFSAYFLYFWDEKSK